MKSILSILFFATISPVFALLTPTSVVSIPMRDGKSLAADVYVPSGCSSCPTILIQTPYNRLLFRVGLPLGTGEDLASSPFNWVVVDWRGFYGSAAAAVSGANRGEDGYDVIEWIKSQSWSNGKVGTWGPSALGGIQYQTMKEQHPNHTCAVPIVAHPQTHYEGYFYGGVLEISRLEQLDALGYGLSPVILANPYYNVTWSISESSTWYPSSIKIPTLQIGGWYDHNIDRMIDWYEVTRQSADAAVQDEQWLLIGPWVHGGTGIANVGSATQGELSYPDAATTNNTMAMQFFRHYLLDENNGWETTSKITYYELGKNSWNSSDNASIEITNYETLFLNAGGLLQGANGTGSTSFTSDPRNPSPTIGGPTLSDDLDQGPYDQISLEGRPDVITFSSGDLITDVSVSGRILLAAHVQCDQADADLAVRLTDVYPDGRNMLINDGIKRLRFRNGYTAASESFMTPSGVYEVTVELPFVNYTWKAGHELKIYLSANSDSRWDVNLQNGGTMYAAGDTNTAVIQIHHSATYPSRIQLPGTGVTLDAKETVNSNTLISIYPNPAQRELTIEGEDIRFYSVSDIQGKMLAGKTELYGNKISLESLPKGILILTLYDVQENTHVRKIMREQ